MKNSANASKRIAVLSSIMLAVFVLMFFIYIALHEKNMVYSSREVQEISKLRSFSSVEIEDDDAPAGLRKKYQWRIGEVEKEDACIGFYVVHQLVDVYIADELVYSLKPDSDNRFCRSTSSNWVFIHLSSEDSGKELRVVITPIFKSVSNFNVEFFEGSETLIRSAQVRADLPILIMSLLCIVTGLIMLVAYLYFSATSRHYVMQGQLWGVFLAILGEWKLTDTRASSIIFSYNPLLLGYITITLVFVAIIPVLFLVNERLRIRNRSIAYTAATTVCAIDMFILILQVAGIFEMREMLPIGHLMIIMTAAFVLAAFYVSARQFGRTQERSGVVITVLLVSGVLLDLTIYYATESSRYLLCSLISCIIVAVMVFIQEIATVNTRAYTDSLTGLFNKHRWELLIEDDLDEKSVGVMMFDLNRLKYINDTYGHTMGDKAIQTFANILVNSIPHSCSICRWGGDEFTVLVKNASGEKLRRYMQEVEDSVNEYNATDGQPELAYAVGCAMSVEYPQLSVRELLRIADNRMYKNKELWYKNTFVK